MSEIKKVGIIGQGKMGTSIFNYLLDFHFDLSWACSPGADTEKITRQFERRIRRSFDAGIIDHQRSEHLLKTKISNDLTVLQSCDLIIESVPEIPDLKRNLFLRLDEIVQPEAIFTSNASSINPSEIAPGGSRSGKFAGMHFFYPVPLKNIVEITVCHDTTEETQKTVEFFLKNIKRRYILLNEHNSFILNKIFLNFQNDAFLLVESGQCSYQQMDQLVRAYFFPFGVFDFCDSVGIDTMLSSIRNYTRDYPHKNAYSQLIATLEALVLQGRLGLKTQEGFYKYPLDDQKEEESVNTAEIVGHLRQSWHSTLKYFTSDPAIPMDDLNHSIMEYFNISSLQF